MNKYTSAPWLIDKNTIYALQDTYYNGIKYVENRFFASVQAGGTNTAPKEEVEANARLIASAPELLEACKLLLPFIERYVPKENSFAYECKEKAGQAIAKAERIRQ